MNPDAPTGLYHPTITISPESAAAAPDGTITIPIMAVSSNFPTPPQPRNRAERRAAARGEFPSRQAGRRGRGC